MIEPEEFPELDVPQVTSISQVDVETVRGESVRMLQSSAGEVAAEEVFLQQSAAANVHGDHISTHESALAMVSAGEVVSQNSAIAFAQAEKMSVSGYTGAIVAGSAEVRHSRVGYLAGRDVHAEDVRTGILLARSVNGSVTTLFSTRDALIAGLVGGLFGGLMLLLGRMLFGRR